MKALVRRLIAAAKDGMTGTWVPPEQEAYERLRRKGFCPAAIIDVGAYEGNWTRLAKQVFPEAPVLMVEAQPSKLQILEKVRSQYHGVRIESAVLAEQAGRQIRFFEMETGSSYYPERSDAPRTETMMISRTLDQLTECLPEPLFLKIDVQGAELDVLRGGRQTLARCEVVQLETALLPYNEGAPDLQEVLSFMADSGFYPIDISGFSRPNGEDLAQIDVLFASSGSTLRRSFFEFSGRG
jgi:FkbM family methyltransferase